MDYFCWATGCINMGLSLAFQAYAHHSKSIAVAQKESLLRATNVHQIASLGFILLSFKGASLPMTLMLSAATFLFPYVTYYQMIANGGQRVMLSSLVPKGGALHIIFWVNFGLFYFSSNTMNSIGLATNTYFDAKANKIE